MASQGGVGVLMNGWFSEVNDQWPGQAMSLQIEEVLLDEKSQYQHVQVFKSKTFGNVLVLDGVIQLTERDEMAYQEMITHLPMFSHPNPENVLIVGGGDGGVIREVVKHKTVKHICICEIDKVVIEAGKKFFPNVAAAWDDERVTLVCGDANEYLQKPEVEGKYDVIISDTSDPVGPAQALFEAPFYRAMEKALRPGGRICTQAESMWMHLELIKKLVREATPLFASVEYASTQIPTYPCGQIGLLLCTKKGGRSKSCHKPARKIPKGDEDKFRYYTSELHTAAFILPAFAERACKEAVIEAREAMGQTSHTTRSAKKGKKEEEEKEETEQSKGKKRKGDEESDKEEEATEEAQEKEEEEAQPSDTKKQKTQ